MFLPIGDTPNPRRFTPFVNYALIGLNLAIYVLVSLPLSAQGVDLSDPDVREYLRNILPSLPQGVPPELVVQNLDAYDIFVFAHGYKPGAPELPDLFLSLFLHGGFAHLAGNMLFLWIYGDNVEHHLGRAPYLAVYLATGVLATISFALFAGASMVPLVGASGAISGVLGLYFLLFPRNKVKLLVALFPFFFDVILLPARWVLGFFLIVDNLLPVVIGSRSGVAYGAHIGGFLSGLAIAFVGERLAWRLPRRTRRKPGAAPAPVPEPRSALERALEGGDHRTAVDLALGLPPAELDDLRADDLLKLAEWLADAGSAIAANSLLRRALHRKNVDQARVYLTLGLIRLRQGQPTAAYQHILSVFDFDPDPETEERAREALDLIGANRKPS